MRSRIGYPVRKADVLTEPGVPDHWYAVGAVDSFEYRLDTRRVWLWGATSRRWALLLSFAPPGGFLDDSVKAGQRRHATLHFYPGSGQYRALIGEQLDRLETASTAAGARDLRRGAGAVGRSAGRRPVGHQDAGGDPGRGDPAERSERGVAAARGERGVPAT